MVGLMDGAAGPNDLERFVNHLLGMPSGPVDGAVAGDGFDAIEPPDHWLSQRVQLRNNQRTIEGTVPAFMCQQVGLDKRDPPKVTVYFDPITELVMFDIAGRFSDGERHG